MRINVETFMALTVLLGAGGAITAAVMTSGNDDEPATTQAKEEPAKAEPAPKLEPTPVIPTATKPETTPPVAKPGETTGTFESELLEPVPDEDPTVIPGPDVERF